MITSTLGFAMRIILSSYKCLEPVRLVVQHLLPLTYRRMASKAIKENINFNGKHLRKGDPLPPYNGKLRIYNMRFCPFAHRTILALLAKNVDFEVVNVHTADKPEWLTQKSAFGKVPSIEIKEDLCIYESLVTVEYLDDVFPQRPLLSKDPLKKAFDKIIVESSGPLHAMFIKFIREPESITDDNVAAYNNSLRFIQKQLKNRGTMYFGGEEPGYADYMLWPWFERLFAVQEENEKLNFNKPEFKLLNEYISKMLEDPSVSRYSVPKKIQLKVYASYKHGVVPDYDVLVE